MQYFLTRGVENGDPPSKVREFRKQVANALGDGWEVHLCAYDDEAPEQDSYVSAALVAEASEGLQVEVVRYRGSDTVLVHFAGRDPVPFEDLAVAKGEIRLDELALRAEEELEDDSPPQPMVAFDRTLELLRKWRRELVRDLDPNNEKMERTLRKIADRVMAAAGLFH